MIIYKPFHRGGYYAAEPDPIRFSYGFQDLLAGIAETSYDSDRVPGNVVLEQHPLAEVAEITINQFPYIFRRVIPLQDPWSERAEIP